MKKITISSLCLLLFTGLFGQGSYRMAVPPGAQVDISQVKTDYYPHLQHLQAPFPGGEASQTRLEAIKKDLDGKYRSQSAPLPSASEKTATAASPWMGRNFRSNITIQGVPNDNDLAISNDGKIVSVINSNIWMHDMAGTNLQTVSLEAWSASLGLPHDKYDPRALYDPLHDRFIVVCLNGFADSTSHIVVGFSQTNDPTGSWNLYALPGDPLDDSLWTDYPIIALTEHELFITGNLLQNSQSWQTGFVKSLCWQIDLDNAYLGDTLDTRLWVRPEFGGAAIRNLCPVQGGSQPTGPNLYLLSNRNFDVQNDTVFLMEITDTLNAPGVQLNVGYLIADVPYGVPPNAPQSISQQLSTNDARWLDAFIENDKIQFVGNCVDTVMGHAGVYHGTISNVSTTPVLNGWVIRDDTVGYGYPGIAWMGLNSPSSDEALIAINYSGPYNTKHPGCGAIYSDGQGDYSELVIAKRGAGFINAINPTVERWGDYTGIQRKYDEQGVIWIAATWGQTSHLPATWVAEFNHPSIVGRPGTVPETEALVFPNPFSDMVAVEFNLEYEQAVDIGLYDMTGRKVAVLMSGRAKSGTNRFSFSPRPLPAGMYVLMVKGPETVIVTEKIVKD